MEHLSVAFYLTSPRSARLSMSGEKPEFFSDLNLDQIVASITAGREEYNLTPFFYTPLRRVETINYRHNILRDFENQALLGHISSFGQEMRAMRAISLKQTNFTINTRSNVGFSKPRTFIAMPSAV